MRPKDMRRSKSASALQSAAAMSLKGSDPAGSAAAFRDSASLRLPAVKAKPGSTGRVSTWSSQPAARPMPQKDAGLSAAQVGEDQLDQLQKATEEPRKARLGPRPMTPVMEEDLDEGQQPDVADSQGEDADEPEDEEYLHHMDEVESELEAELEAALKELAGFMQDAKIDELNGDLRMRMAKLAPRMKTLDERGRNLRSGHGRRR